MLEQRFDGLKETDSDLKDAIEGLREAMQRLLEQGQQRGQAMGEMQAAISGLQNSVVSLKKDTAVIRSGLFLARVGGRTARFAVLSLPVGVGLFVWVGERWDLLLNFIRGTGR